MAQSASTSTSLAGTAEESGGRLVEGVLERLWHLLTSMRFGLVVILFLAVLTGIGTVISQAPPGVLANPDAKAAWLAEIRPRYGGFTGPLDALQLFGVFSSVWFRAGAGLLMASVIACSVHRTGGLWKTATQPNVLVGEGFFEHAPYREAMAFRQAPADVADRVRAVLKRHHFRMVSADDGALHLYADRNRWGPLGSLAGHISLVVIVAGALVGSAFGFRDSQFMIAEGSTEAVPTMAGATVQLVSFKDTYDPTTGQPLDYASDLLVTQNGQQLARQTVRVNDPLHVGELTFYQSFFGPAAVIKATDAQGATVYADGVPMDRVASDNRAVGSFAIPSANLTVFLVGTAGTGDTQVKPGQIRLELYNATTGDPITQQSIDLTTPTAVGGVTFTFERETKFTGLSVAKDPGAPLVWLGCFLLVAGFVMVFLFPHRRLWGRVTRRQGGGSALSLAAIGRSDTALETEFTALVTEIRQAFHAPART